MSKRYILKFLPSALLACCQLCFAPPKEAPLSPKASSSSTSSSAEDFDERWFAHIQGVLEYVGGNPLLISDYDPNADNSRFKNNLFRLFSLEVIYYLFRITCDTGILESLKDCETRIFDKGSDLYERYRTSMKLLESFARFRIITELFQLDVFTSFGVCEKSLRDDRTVSIVKPIFSYAERPYHIGLIPTRFKLIFVQTVSLFKLDDSSLFKRTTVKFLIGEVEYQLDLIICVDSATARLDPKVFISKSGSKRELSPCSMRNGIGADTAIVDIDTAFHDLANQLADYLEFENLGLKVCNFLGSVNFSS